LNTESLYYDKEYKSRLEMHHSKQSKVALKNEQPFNTLVILVIIMLFLNFKLVAMRSDANQQLD
jgi:hypothetical protein